MAERRMFSKKVISSARFLKMPATARLLYYDLGMHADDDGIVEAFVVLQTTHAAEDDLRVLVSKGFIRILNDDLVAIIIDWKTNNLIRKDRYTPSIYQYLLSDSDGIPVDNQRLTDGQPMVTPGKERGVKDSIGQYSVGKAIGKEPEPFAPNEYDSIKEEFIKSFSREPDAAFLPSIRMQIETGRKKQDVLEIIRQSAQRHPEVPEAYIIATLKRYQEKMEQPPASPAPTDDPNRPLETWEKIWLEHVKSRRERDRAEAERKEGEPE